MERGADRLDLSERLVIVGRRTTWCLSQGSFRPSATERHERSRRSGSAHHVPEPEHSNAVSPEPVDEKPDRQLRGDREHIRHRQRQASCAGVQCEVEQVLQQADGGRGVPGIGKPGGNRLAVTSGGRGERPGFLGRGRGLTLA